MVRHTRTPSTRHFGRTEADCKSRPKALTNPPNAKPATDAGIDDHGVCNKHRLVRISWRLVNYTEWGNFQLAPVHCISRITYPLSHRDQIGGTTPWWRVSRKTQTAPGERNWPSLESVYKYIIQVYIIYRYLWV